MDNKAFTSSLYFFGNRWFSICVLMFPGTKLLMCKYSMEMGIFMENILIIEDEKDVNRLLAQTLQDAGYKIFSVYNGLDVIKILEEKQFEMVLLDLMLPYRSGYEVLKDIRRISDIPVIVISAKDIFEENNLKMEFEDTGVYYGMADKELLKRIMQNLLKNSLQHAAGDVKVSINGMDKKPFLEILVQNPVGNEERNSVAGLGLSIVKMLVEHMGGEVFAQIEDGIFCTGFTIVKYTPAL